VQWSPFGQAERILKRTKKLKKTYFLYLLTIYFLNVAIVKFAFLNGKFRIHHSSEIKYVTNFKELIKNPIDRAFKRRPYFVKLVVRLFNWS
jgi:hypothetical protein